MSEPRKELTSLIVRYEGVVESLKLAEAEWRGLGADPADFARRTNTAAKIAELRSAADSLPEQIGTARRRAEAFDALQDRLNELEQDAASRLHEVADKLPTPQQLLQLVESDFRARSLRAARARHGGQPPTSLGAGRELARGLQHILSNLDMAQRRSRVTADLAEFADELTLLRGEPCNT